MIRILCYGDSNTWGTIPDGSCKHCEVTKVYPYFLQQILGENYKVICEGMPSRTTDIDDIKQPKGNRNGALFFPTCLISHDPLDYIVLFLGTNDLKDKFNRNVDIIGNVIQEKYIKFTKNFLVPELSKTPKFIIIAPSEIDESKFGGYTGATKKSKQFNKVFKELAKNNDCLFVSNEILECGDDGIHITTESHELLARTLASLIK